MTARPIRVGFVMDQIAGHITTYMNLRSVVELDDEIEPVWGEVRYHLDGQRIEWLHDRVFPFLPAHPFGVARGIVEQRRILQTGPFDVIYTNTATAQYAVGALRDTPSMFDFDSTPVQLAQLDGYEPPTGARPVAALKHRLMRRLFQTVTLNQAWSNWARESVVHDYGIPTDRTIVNPPGVDLELFTPTDRAIRQQDEPAHVLFVGGDFARKGGTHLLEWHRTLDPTRVVLDIVTREDVPKMPGVNVWNDVSPNSRKLQELHHQADVFALPSLGECFGIATIEALASGIPVVVTDVGGTADIVVPGENGFIVSAGSTRELGRAIEAVLDRDDAGEAMRANARLVAEARFDLRKNVAVTIEQIKRLARDEERA